MKTKKILCMIALSALAFNSCKKPKTEPAEPAPPVNNGPTSLCNKWEVISGLSETKYLIIKNDSTISQLDSAQYGFKKLYSGNVTGSIVELLKIYNYTLSNDTLKLTNSAGIVLLKKCNTTWDETNWIIYVNQTDSINSPRPNGDPREDMGFDGSNILWTADATSDTLFKINPLTHQITRIKLNTNYWYGSLSCGAGNTWISNGYSIDKFNVTGGVISTSPTFVEYIKGMALIGQDMWYAWNSSAPNTFGNLSAWNTLNNNTTLKVSQLPIRISGMEYVGGYLYINENQGGIYKCQISPFLVIKNYKMKEINQDGFGYNGLTHDGSKFWITHRHKIMKLDI